jgi:O-antigen/teichoic acid export membrane protein
MTSIRRNVVANFAGSAMNVVVSLAFIPLYLRYLGPEAYGLIGFNATLQAIFGLFDLGIATTVNRAMAQYSEGDREAERRHLLRTFETTYAGIAAAVGLAIFVAAPWIAARWVHIERLPLADVVFAIRLMGIMGALHFPYALYRAAFLGLQRQVLYNALDVTMSLVRSGGAVLVLLFWSRTVPAFFGWYAGVAFLQAVLAAGWIWRLVGGRRGAEFRRAMLTAEWRFALSVSVNTLVGVLLTQCDKVILSGVIPLSMFGYYTLAGTVSSALWYVTMPVNTALFPRFAQLVERKDDAALAALFHKAAQMLAVLLLPAAATLSFFAREVVFLWTRNAVTADATSVIVPLLVAGTASSGLASVPSYLQFAARWPQLMMWTNIGGVVAIVPSIYFLSRTYGAPGAAAVWLLISSSHLFIAAPIMFRRVLRGEQRRWWRDDVVTPLIAAVVPVALIRLAVPAHTTRLTSLAAILAAGCLSTVTAALATPSVRAAALQRTALYLTSHRKRGWLP